MNWITLTKEAIPVTLTTTGYILDKALDASTVVYSINPNISTTLNRAPQSGDTLCFSANMAAATLNKQVPTYSVSPEGTSYFNTFVPTSGMWSGNGLISSKAVGRDGPVTAPMKTSLGTIVGGVLGGLAAIGSAMFFATWYRRRRNRKADVSSSTARQHKEKDLTTLDKIPQKPNDSYIPPSPSVGLFETNSLEPSPQVPANVTSGLPGLQCESRDQVKTLL
ncbi:hypothetical protein BGX33_006302 [Mortierella sp. NVP41]|nr:hypothetical protein BGX33_006302 [Mortierella sp. NVP41]